MKEKNITRVSRDDARKGKTDWEKLRTLTDTEIAASIRNDPDWSEEWDWSEAVLAAPTRKTAISIRVDNDLLDFFKQQGAGYQSRINAVLRSYMQMTRKPKKRA